MNAISCGFCASTAQRVENFCQVCGAPSSSSHTNTAAGKCRACDGALKAGSNFCLTCGTPNFGSTVGVTTPSRGVGTKAKSSPPVAEKPVQVSASVVQLRTAKQDYPSSEEVSEPKKKSKKLVRMLMIVGVALLGGVIYHVVKDKPVPPTPIAAAPTNQQAPKSSTSAPAVAPAPPARGPQPEPIQTQLRTLGSSQVQGLRFSNIYAVRKYEDGAETISLDLEILNNSDAALDVPEVSVTVLVGETDYKNWHFSLKNPRLNSNATTSMTIPLPIDRPPPGALTVKAEITKQAQTGTQKGPSFDCNAARASVEKMICGSPSLSNADRDLAFLYGNVRAVSANPDGLRAEQNQWIRDRNRCETEACLTDMYKSRTSQLQAKISGR